MLTPWPCRSEIALGVAGLWASAMGAKWSVVQWRRLSVSVHNVKGFSITKHLHKWVLG